LIFLFRDISLTDYKGSLLLVFFYPADFECDKDFSVLHKNVKHLRKQFSCEVLACSSDSTMLHSKWVQSARAEGLFSGSFDIPLISDRQGLLSKIFDVFDEEEGTCIKSFLIIDEKSICRQVTVSSLDIADMMANITDTINIIQTSKLEEKKPAESGMLDRLWRKTLKIPESPKRSMLRSVSTSRRKTSRSRSASVETRGLTSQAEEFAEIIAQSVKAMMSKHVTGVDLMDHNAGEIRLSQGRLSGLWKVSRGGECLLECDHQWNNLSFSLVVRGLLSSYHFSGRRIRGELSCTYDRVVYRMRVRQRVSSECDTKMELVQLNLQEVKGARMNVTGFGLLNWIAGKTVSNLIQETVLQALEDVLSGGVGLALENTAFYFQPRESQSYSLYPAGVITCH